MLENKFNNNNRCFLIILNYYTIFLRIKKLPDIVISIFKSLDNENIILINIYSNSKNCLLNCNI